MRNDRARSLAEEIHNKQKIMEMELDVLFPMTGGYTGKPYDDLLGLHMPEPKDFKYLWRWWARTFINDDPNNNLQYLNNEVAKVLGGTGGAGKSTFDLDTKLVSIEPLVNPYLPPKLFSDAADKLAVKAMEIVRKYERYGRIKSISLSLDEPSTVKIGISFTYADERKEHDVLVASYDELFSRYFQLSDSEEIDTSFLKSIPRIKMIARDKVDYITGNQQNELIRMVRRSIVKILSHLFIPKKVTLKLFVYSSHAPSEISIHHANYLKYLLASLILGSIGYMSSRGMGSIVPPRDPNSITINAERFEDDIRNSYRELLDILFSGASNVDINRLRETLGLRTPLRINDMPMVPILHPDYSFVIVKRCTSSQDELSILSKISQTISGRYSLCNRVDSNTHSLNWALCKLIMGAPRRSISSKYPRGLRGYEDCIPRRRRSAISYKMLAYPNSKTILTAGFLSRDIVNRGRRSRCWNNSSFMRKLDMVFKSIGQEISRISC